MSVSVSVLIITKNEEKVITRCLTSVLWAEEIIVIDAESSDETPALCQDPKAPWASKIKFYQRPWLSFKDQRNFALTQAKQEWVFVIDADEQCSLELAQKIKEIVLTSSSYHLETSLSPSSSEKAHLGHNTTQAAYKVRRIEYFLNRPIEFGVWNPSYQDRFFKKSGVYYINDVHEYPIFKTPAQLIHEPIYHDPQFNPERFLLKMNRYTSIEAKERVKNGQRTHLIHLLFAGPAMFFKNYFYYQAYKDGIHGVIISLLEGVSRTVRHIKIWQYTREQNKK